MIVFLVVTRCRNVSAVVCIGSLEGGCVKVIRDVAATRLVVLGTSQELAGAGARVCHISFFVHNDFVVLESDFLGVSCISRVDVDTASRVATFCVCAGHAVVKHEVILNNNFDIGVRRLVHDETVNAILERLVVEDLELTRVVFVSGQDDS